MKHTDHETRKITVNLPAALLDGLLKESGKGLTELLTDLLEQEKTRRAWQALLSVAEEGSLPYTYEEVKTLRAQKKDRNLSQFATRKKRIK